MRVAESCYSESWSVSSKVGMKEFLIPLFSICGKLLGHYPVAGWLATDMLPISGRRDHGIRATEDVIPPFSGEGDVVGWIKKVNLVARLQKVQDLASFIPLFLHGDALALYLEMNNEDLVRAEQIEMRLVTAFTEGPFEAYEKLKQFK